VGSAEHQLGLQETAARAAKWAPNSVGDDVGFSCLVGLYAAAGEKTAQTLALLSDCIPKTHTFIKLCVGCANNARLQHENRSSPAAAHRCHGGGLTAGRNSVTRSTTILIGANLKLIAG
jgi:hypothetical protein